MSDEEVISGGRCFKRVAEDGPPLIQNGHLVLQAHHIGWIVASFFTVVAIITSFWLVNKHLKWYTNKLEQRYIVRILFMVPIYALISLASFFFWNHSTPLILIRDGYESTVLTSFFYLLLNYLSHDPDEQRNIFMKAGLSREADAEALRKREQPKKWMFPLGFIKWKPSDGLYFLQLMKWGVLQYCVIRPTTTLAAVILNYIGLYCEDSWGLGWGHVYITVIVSISVTIAMYCLLQLYFPVSTYLAPQKPILKLFAIKAIVFLTFWQATFLSILSMFGVVKDTKYMTADDINIGIGALLETFEMMLFGFLHLKAFTYKVYRLRPMPDSKEPAPARMSRLRALGHAMDFRETFRELWIGMIYLWDKIRGQEPTLDVDARRTAYYEHAFGRPRPSAIDGRKLPNSQQPNVKPKGSVTFPTVEVDIVESVEERGTRLWLGHGSHYGYGIYREKSDDLEVQIERELERRGYGSHRGHVKPVPNAEEGYGYTHGPQRSWWRSIYNRISQTGAENEEILTHASSKRVNRSTSRKPSKSRSRHASRDLDSDQRVLPDHHYELDEPPPPSLIRTYRSSQKQQQALYSPVPSHADDDLLSPLPVFGEHQNFHIQRPFQHQRSKRKSGSRLPPPSPNIPVSSDPRTLAPPSSSPPPQSLLPPIHYSSSRSDDSLLGRVFPSKSSDAQLSAHGTDNTHISGLPPHKRSNPQSLENGYQIGMAGERSAYYSQVPTQIEPEKANFSATLLSVASNVDSDPVFGQAQSLPERVQGSATHPANLEIKDPQTVHDQWSPTKPHPVGESEISVHPSQNFGNPSSRPSPAAEPKVSKSKGLRRSSALVQSPRDGPSRGRRQSQPPAKSPRHAYTLQSSGRRLSTPITAELPQPLVSPPDNTYHSNRPYALPSSNARYSPEHMNSSIIQPSSSGTAAASKFPDVIADTGLRGNDSFRSLSIPLVEHTPASPHALSAPKAYKYPSHAQYNGSRHAPNTGRAQGHTNNKDHPAHGPWS